MKTNPKTLLSRIECAYLPVTDAAAAAAWYERVLGLKLRSPIEPGRGAIMVMGTGQWLFLLPSPGGHPLNFMTTGWTDDRSPFEMFPICFETEDMNALEAAVRESGVWVENKLRDEGPCGLQLNFKDPDGNKFQAWQRPPAAPVGTPFRRVRRSGAECRARRDVRAGIRFIHFEGMRGSGWRRQKRSAVL